METFPTRKLHSPTQCQYLVWHPLEVICVQFPQSVIYHYVDDILLTDSNVDILEKNCEEENFALLRSTNCS